MWYGCFPSMAVMLVGMSVPHIFVYFEHKFLLGTPYARYLCTKFDTHNYLRDMRLGNGDPYKQLGLDCLCIPKECDCS